MRNWRFCPIPPRVADPEVAAALRLFDAPIMKLDAGDEETFEKINHPVSGLTIDEFVWGAEAAALINYPERADQWGGHEYPGGGF